MKAPPLFVSTTVVLLLGRLTLPSLAAVKTDGTLGHGATLTGPNYIVGAELGRQRGANLFHSFDQFTLARRESATFTGPASVQNIFARVTGGEPSSIGGILRCTIPNASFFLINPAGVVFGREATLDIKGSLSVTTANQVRLGSSGRFIAGVPQGSVLSSAPASAFGFLNSKPGQIILRGNNRRVLVNNNPQVETDSKLTVPSGRSIELVGGAVDLSGATLSAPAGQINIVSVTAPQTIALPVVPRRTVAPGATQAGFGTVRLMGNSLIDVASGRGGEILIRSQDLSVTGGSQISAASARQHSLRERGGMIRVRTGTLSVYSGGNFSVDDAGAASGGLIDIEASGAVRLDRQNDPEVTGVSAQVDSGSGGNIRIVAGVLDIRNGATVTTNAKFPFSGNAGNISIGVRSLTDDAGNIVSPAATGGRSGNIAIDASGDAHLTHNALISSTSFGSNGGNILLKAFNLSLSRGATITTVSAATGGNIDINVKGVASIFGSKITTLAGLNGGNINVDPSVTVLNHSNINASATVANGGNISFVTTGVIVSPDTSVVASGGEKGLSGRITFARVNALELTFIALSAALFSPDALLRPVCGEAITVSSFQVAARGGIPSPPEMWSPGSRPLSESAQAEQQRARDKAR